MSDPGQPALVVEPVASPVSSEPAPAVTPSAEPAPAPAETTVAETPAADTLKPHTETPSLLEQAGKVEEKPADAVKPPEADKPKEGEKKVEGAVEPPKPVEAAPAEPFKFEPYTIPEGFKADDTRINSLNEVLTKADLSPQQKGQALIDLHVSEMQNYDSQTRQHQHDAFAETRAGWRKEVMGDPELGGSGFKTAMTDIAQMRDKFVSRHKEGTKAYQADWDNFNNFLAATGAGDNPAFLRFIRNVSRWANEPAPITPDIRPPGDIGLKPKTKGRMRDLYTNGSEN